jgi:FkbH-like protein
LVFVDDNPAERERIRQSLPQIAVPELPPDPAHYVRCLARAGYFEAVAFTPEDRQRHEQYAANASREAERASAQTLSEFLAGLGMSIQYGRLRTVDLERVTQLINKTNQFNLTTRRRSLQEVAALAADERFLALQFRLVDKFGDNGLVSVMILRPAEVEAGVLEIDTWVMSCRVFGRELEFEAMNVAVEAARERGVRELRGAYIQSSKNAVVSALYSTLGFARSTNPPIEAEATYWRMPLADYKRRATFIARAPD